MNKETLLEVLPTGEIKFKRGNREHNKTLLEILSQIVSDSKLEEIKKFFKESEEVVILEGNEIFCG